MSTSDEFCTLNSPQNVKRRALPREKFLIHASIHNRTHTPSELIQIIFCHFASFVLAQTTALTLM